MCHPAPLHFVVKCGSILIVRSAAAQCHDNYMSANKIRNVHFFKARFYLVDKNEFHQDSMFTDCICASVPLV